MKIVSVFTILSTAAICCLLVEVIGNPVDLRDFDIEADNDTTTVNPTTSPALTSDETQSSTMLSSTTMFTGSTTMFTGSTPISFVTSEQSPVTGNSSGSTGPITGSSSIVTGTTLTTTTPPLGSTQPSTGGFDGGSFAGGIALGIGILLLVVLTYKCYVMRQNGQQNYKAM